MRAKLAEQTSGTVEAAESASTWLGFLAPEDIVSWRAPRDLAQHITSGLAGDDGVAFIAANRLALEAFRIGELSIAAAVCNLEIGYAVARYRSSGDGRFMLLGLQPVINLVRLNGYVGDLDAALRGLDGLERIAAGEPQQIHDLDINTSVLADTAVARPLRALARNNCLAETAKILWRRRQPEQMLAACDRLVRRWPRASTLAPSHAAEAPWLVAAATADGRTGLPAEQAFRRVCALHLVAQSQPERRGCAALTQELFASRPRDCAPKYRQALARDLASLGDSLIQMGRPEDGLTCLNDAHRHASAADPSLANRIRARWASRARAGLAPDSVPPELPCPRLTVTCLGEAFQLAGARLGA